MIRLNIGNPATAINVIDDNSYELKIWCAVCIKENRPSPHHYSFVNVTVWRPYAAIEFFDAEGAHHYHCRQTGVFNCTFGHKFERHNLPYVKCPSCGYNVNLQRRIEAEREVCIPPRVKPLKKVTI